MSWTSRFGLVVLVAVASGCTAPVSRRGSCCGDGCSAESRSLPPLKVGVYADAGPSGIGAVEWFRLINESPEMELKLLDGEMVREGA